MRWIVVAMALCLGACSEASMAITAFQTLGDAVDYAASTRTSPSLVQE